MVIVCYQTPDSPEWKKSDGTQIFVSQSTEVSAFAGHCNGSVENGNVTCSIICNPVVVPCNVSVDLGHVASVCGFAIRWTRISHVYLFSMQCFC